MSMFSNLGFWFTTGTSPGNFLTEIQTCIHTTAKKFWFFGAMETEDLEYFNVIPGQFAVFYYYYFVHVRTFFLQNNFGVFGAMETEDLEYFNVIPGQFAVFYYYYYYYYFVHVRTFFCKTIFGFLAPWKRKI